MFRNPFNSVSGALCLSPSPRHVLHWALHRHPKYNYSLQLNGDEGSSGIHRNRKWSGGLDRGGNSKSLIHLAKPWQQAPGDSYCGISGIKQCSSNHEKKLPSTLANMHTDVHASTEMPLIFPCGA